MTYPAIAALPVAPDPNDPGTFNPRASAFVAALPGFRTQSNALAAWFEQQAIQMPVGTGGVAPLIANAGVTDNSIATGFYWYSSSNGSTGGPSGVAFGHLIHMRRSSGGGEVQLMVVETVSGGELRIGSVLSRARTAGAWSAWSPIGWNSGGTGPNGRYVRYDDGTQICWQIITTSTSAEAAVTFPAAFTSLTDLRTTFGVNASAAIALSPRLTNRTVSGMDVSCFNASNARVATAVEAVTIGRWKA